MQVLALNVNLDVTLTQLVLLVACLVEWESMLQCLVSPVVLNVMLDDLRIKMGHNSIAILVVMALHKVNLANLFVTIALQVTLLQQLD